VRRNRRPMLTQSARSRRLLFRSCARTADPRGIGRSDAAIAPLPIGALSAPRPVG
jgi:hypothetical protein